MSGTLFRYSTIVSELFEENCYIAHLDGRDDCLVVDPGLEPGRIQQQILADRLTPVAILNTHGHSDHIAGNEAMKRTWPDAPLVIGAGDAPKLTDPVGNLSAPFGLSLISPEADVLLHEGDTYEAAGFTFEILEIPGHSIGHIVFLWKGEPEWVVFGGDVLFRGGIGRSDFPDGDPRQLVEGIHTKLFTLPDTTLVLSGHGPPTTIGAEKESNPFVGRPAGYQG